MSAAIPEPEADWARSEQIKQAIDKVLELDPPDIAWMTGELGNALLSANYSAYTMMQMELIKRGVHPAEAQQSAQQQAPLLIFQLGLQVGTELESTRAMRELFGE
ncbi:hypothetical protein GCM10028801_31380 [Nocardioides maradonensis]